METVISLCQKAKAAANILGIADNQTRSNAINAIADALVASTDKILAANKIDIENGKAGGLSDSLLDRLMLNADRIIGMADGARKVAAQNDPLGKVLYEDTRPNGLNIKKVSVPLGVIGIIFEARPNVTCDAAVLCIKSGNCTVLRGGKEAINSNVAIAKVMRDALHSVGLPSDCICLIEDTNRSSSVELMRANGLIDVIIPRGGAGLIKATVQNATVPVIETGTGNCHLFVDESADYNMAADGSGFDKKILKQVIKKLENNGNDDIVTLKTLTQYEPEDDKYLIQVKEMRGNSAYIGFQPASVFSVKAVLDTYKQAKSDMVEAASGELANYVI